jgi:4-hydroxythreonine-4-phosphate dehydrogenase
MGIEGKKRKLKIGISSGDPNGIGYEIILKALSDTRISEIITPIFYGSKAIGNYYTKILNLPDFKMRYLKSVEEIKGSQVYMIDLESQDFEVKPGLASEDSARLAVESLEKSTADLKEGKLDALVTGPIDKDAMRTAGFEFPGHTEYLLSISKADDCLMIMQSERSRIGLVTAHIPLKEVAAKLTTEAILKKLTLLNRSLKEDYSIRKPKIAVLGLNPHSGDNGLLGKEEKEIIEPAIRQAKTIDILAFGPFAADGFFGSGNFLKYDGILAMYHDQGLIPAKMLSQGKGVNFTAGLEFVRTSPDHGTAYDIAGKGVASEEALLQAFFAAQELVQNREMNRELQQDAFVPNKTNVTSR